MLVLTTIVYTICKIKVKPFSKYNAVTLRAVRVAWQFSADPLSIEVNHIKYNFLHLYIILSIKKTEFLKFEFNDYCIIVPIYT